MSVVGAVVRTGGQPCFSKRVAATAPAGAALPNGWRASARHAKMRVLSMAHRFFFTVRVAREVLSRDLCAWSRSRRIEEYLGASRSGRC